MSACKTGCGQDAKEYLCKECEAAWQDSGERLRNLGALGEDWPDERRAARMEVALVDFCDRMRAERRPEVMR